MSSPDDIAKRIEALLRSRYRQTPRDENEKALDLILKFCQDLQDHKKTSNEIIRESAEIIHRTLPFQEIAIAVKDQKDGLYKFNAIIGFKKDTEDHLRSLAFTKEEVLASDREPGVKITNLIDLTIAEAPFDRPDEEYGYNRPTLITIPRKNYESFAFGDYIDVYLHSFDNELIGFIELSAPRDGKMPSGNVMKWLEFFAIIIASLIQQRSKDNPYPK